MEDKAMEEIWAAIAGIAAMGIVGLFASILELFAMIYQLFLGMWVQS